MGRIRMHGVFENGKTQPSVVVDTEKQSLNYPFKTFEELAEELIETPMIPWHRDIELILFLLMIVLGIPGGMLCLFSF